MIVFRMFICFMLSIILTSCDQKPLYSHKQKKQSENTSKKISSEISDAADYATGAMPLKVLENSKKSINKISEKRNSDLKKQLETKD